MNRISRPRSPRRRLRWLAALLGCVLGCAGSAAAADGAGAACPNASLAAATRSYLPDCRALELVSPPFKDGVGPEQPHSGELTISSDGDHVLASILGGFAGTENDEQNADQSGATYEFSRTPSGWEPEALDPPASLAARSAFVAASSDLTRSLWELSDQARPGEEVESENMPHSLAIREPSGTGAGRFVAIGPEDAPAATQHLFAFAGASRDLSTVVFGIFGEGALWPGDQTHPGRESLYEYTGTGNAEPELVGVRNEGPLVGSAHRNEHAELISQCGTELGAGTGPEGSTFNAVSSDGSIVYFTALECEPPDSNELYARIDGASTVAISEPAADPECTGVCREDLEEESKHRPATFQGASSDGHEVFFTTSQPLLDADHDSANDVYEAELEGGALTHLTMVSHGEATGDPTPGAGAEVTGGVRISEDGSHAYFVARGKLTATPNGNGETAEVGGYNLYDYDASTGRTSLVASLLTPAEIAATKAAIEAEEEARITSREEECVANEEECESELEELREEVHGNVTAGVNELVFAATGIKHNSPNARPFETTPDGRFAIFETTTDLEGTDDTSTVKQLFEYDGATDTVTRASIGDQAVAGGYEDDGNTETSADAPRMLLSSYGHGGYPTAESSALSLSEDGRVFFASQDDLFPGAIEGGENVYEYGPPAVDGCGQPAGCLSLVSPGEELSYFEPHGRPRLLGVDQSGADAFFSSTLSLLPRDTDSQLDWYDARVDGGFEEPQSSAECRDTCQTAGTPAPGLPQAGGSATQLGGEAAPAAPAQPLATPKKPSRPTAAQRLAQALKKCRRQRGRRRRACEAAARKQARGKPSQRVGKKTK